MKGLFFKDKPKRIGKTGEEIKFEKLESIWTNSNRFSRSRNSSLSQQWEKPIINPVYAMDPSKNPGVGGVGDHWKWE